MRFKRYKWRDWALNTVSRFYRDGPEVLAVDTETTGVAFFDEAFCCQIAWLDKKGRVQSGYFELSAVGEGDISDEDVAVVKEQLAAVLSIPALVFHNAKFDLQKLIQAGVLERSSLTGRVHDTECLAQLLDEHRPKGLKDLKKSVLGQDDTEAKHLARVRRKLKLTKKDGYHLLPRKDVVPYAVDDAEVTIGIFRDFYPRVMSDDQLSNLYASEMELLVVMLDVESKGIGVDLERLATATKEYRTEVLKTELSIGKLTGKKVWYPEKSGQKTPEGHINPNSHEQVRWVLSDRNVSVPNTQSDTLKATNDEFAHAMVELRERKKILTYLDAIGSEHRGGRIHPWFNLFKPITGRMSSSKAGN